MIDLSTGVPKLVSNHNSADNYHLVDHREVGYCSTCITLIGKTLGVSVNNHLIHAFSLIPAASHCWFASEAKAGMVPGWETRCCWQW
jgi:hypothetical protein